MILPDPSQPETLTLELDELWSFVQRRKNKVWIWFALCRAPRQIVAFAVGDRGVKTCRKLWAAIPVAYKQGHCFSDFWEAYSKVIPQEQHSAVGKETGETAHAERWINTLRQRLARFVRQTLSFSKTDTMHPVSLKLYIHRYNCLRAELWYKDHPS